MGAFEDALGNFVKGFAYTGAVKHLLNRGYSVERIMQEYDYRLSREEVEKIAEEVRAEQEAKSSSEPAPGKKAKDTDTR
ncbi:MAG: hypothetical protein IK152_02030 [Lachnospiraceae bacterium]|nr:hypothetical protein [Lachnospiraceae bacterium]